MSPESEIKRLEKRLENSEEERAAIEAQLAGFISEVEVRALAVDTDEATSATPGVRVGLEEIDGGVERATPPKLISVAPSMTCVSESV